MKELTDILNQLSQTCTRNADSMGGRGSVAQYNGNNAWLYNGNNGTLDNNNKYNNNSVRPVLESQSTEYGGLESALIPIHEWYMLTRQCARRKKSKPSYLIFYCTIGHNIHRLCRQVRDFEYMPKDGICFVITKPRIREVIAADFSDRLVQTWFVNQVMPKLERDFLDEDSYACRKSKGGLAAVKKLHDYIYEDSHGYTKDVWLAKTDVQGFFMSIDTDLAVRKLDGFITSHITDASVCNTLRYLARIIYQSEPQSHCIIKSTDELMKSVPEGKSLMGKHDGTGIAIGNVTSQMMALFITTFNLSLLRHLGYRFAHYTDDTVVVVKDKRKWLRDVRYLADFMRETLHLTLHPKKRYLQHYSKGVEFLGYRLKFSRTLPSERIIHNFSWAVERAVRKAEYSIAFMWADAEPLMRTVNSYLGLLRHCDAYRMRKSVIGRIKASPFREVYDFADDYTKINIRKGRTCRDWYMRRNRIRKHTITHY